MSKNQTHTIYKLADGSRVPSVTTCLSVIAKPAIIHWAWQQGVSGLDYRKTRDQASDIGSLVHYLILCHLKGVEPDLSDYSDNLLKASAVPMDKFKGWLGEHKVEPIALETPLVSEIYGFGGTFDFLGRVDGKVVLGDFKTSGAVYLENYCQLAAYEKLVYVNKLAVPDSLVVFRVGKNVDEPMEVKEIKTLAARYWEIFLHAKEIYNLSKGKLE